MIWDSCRKKFLSRDFLIAMGQRVGNEFLVRLNQLEFGFDHGLGFGFDSMFDYRFDCEFDYGLWAVLNRHVFGAF
jgi:hypothetical protein